MPKILASICKCLGSLSMHCFIWGKHGNAEWDRPRQCSVSFSRSLWEQSSFDLLTKWHFWVLLFLPFSLQLAGFGYQSLISGSSWHLTVSYTIISLQPDGQGTCHRLEAVRGSAQANLCVHPHTGNYGMIPMAAVTFSMPADAGSAVSRKPEKNPVQTSLSHLLGLTKDVDLMTLQKQQIYMYDMYMTWYM